MAVVAFHDAVYGEVLSTPISTPSTQNRTCVTPTASPAVAVTGTAAPDTVLPAAGLAMLTVGAGGVSRWLGGVA